MEREGILASFDIVSILTPRCTSESNVITRDVTTIHFGRWIDDTHTVCPSRSSWELAKFNIKMATLEEFDKVFYNMHIWIPLLMSDRLMGVLEFMT